MDDPKHTFDPEAHAANKERSRQQDERDLASGAKTREQLRRENGVFALPNAVLHLDRVSNAFRDFGA